MANRHLARSIVLQSLFEWDFGGREDDRISAIVERNITEFAPGAGDFSFVRELINKVLQKRSDIDTIISKAAPDWPLEKISLIDRNVLRIGLYELLFADKTEVPAKVAINEAIELAKTFGGDNSGKFVNGVLGSVYKEMGEPGKDAVSKRKVKKDEVPFEKMPIIKMIGSIVYAKDGEDVYLAFVHDIFGHWTLAKGKVQPEENEEDAVHRKVKEELGLGKINIKDTLGTNEYVASDPEKGKIRKQVSYFLSEAKYVPVKLGESGGLDDAKWFKIADILELNFYSDILPIVTKAINLLLQKQK